MTSTCEMDVKSGFIPFSQLTATLPLQRLISWYTRHMKVLVIEDEASIREFEVTYLRDAGYETIEAADGVTAIELFEEHKPDLAIVDINLPKMSGLDVCKAIRMTSAMPILIVTAKGSDEDEVKGFSMGADD